MNTILIFASLFLTIELAQGTNIPRVNAPSTGPPTIPKIPSAAYNKHLIWYSNYVYPYKLVRWCNKA